MEASSQHESGINNLTCHDSHISIRGIGVDYSEIFGCVLESDENLKWIRVDCRPGKRSEVPQTTSYLVDYPDRKHEVAKKLVEAINQERERLFDKW